MWRYLLKRFVLMFPTLLGVAIFTFFLIRVIPGDVVELRLAGDRGSVSPEALQSERARFGLDQPIWRQFVTWIGGAARLDFGTSMWTGSPIWEEIRLRFALSFQVAIMATIVAVLLAIPLGVMAALKQDTWVDYAVRVFSVAWLPSILPFLPAASWSLSRSSTSPVSGCSSCRPSPTGTTRSSRRSCCSWPASSSS